MATPTPATEGDNIEPERIAVSHVDVTPLAQPPALRERLARYVARTGLLAGAANLGVATHTLERALGGLRVLRAIERQLTDVLDRDDRAQAITNEGNEGR